MGFEGYFPRELPPDNELLLNVVATVKIFGLNVNVPIDSVKSDICNNEIVKPLDNQTCGEPGTYILTHEFAAVNPLPISLSGLKVQGPAIITDNFGNRIAECS